ncbi:cytochrome P450 7B1 [Diretmus argenteus]
MGRSRWSVECEMFRTPQDPRLGSGLIIRDGEPPLVTGWVPFLGKALEFGKDTFTFLEEHKKKYGDIFTVQIAGKYMTFIMNPVLYPHIIRHGRQLDFHEFSYKVAPLAFGYEPLLCGKFPGMAAQIRRSYQLLQGDELTSLMHSMMGNLTRVFQQDYLGEGRGKDTEEGCWKMGGMYEFCNSVMFEATFLTMYGRPADASRHREMSALREHFVKFDAVFPLLIAQIPIWLLGRTKEIREKLVKNFLPQRVSCWSNTSKLIRSHAALFRQYEQLKDIDKAAHHFAILWASVGNTVPATFWAMYHLVSHPEALDAVRHEIHSVCGLKDSGDGEITVTREQLDQLLLLDSALNESLRLSSASMNIRVAQDDFNLKLEGEESVAVRRGDIIALYPQSMHMDPEIYEEPETYRHDRFMQDGRLKTDFYKDGQRLKYYRMPFGSGPSMCPGRYLAVNEIKQFLVLLLLSFDLQLEEGQVKVTAASSRAGLGILLPANEVQFRYRPRSA